MRAHARRRCRRERSAARHEPRRRRARRRRRRRRSRADRRRPSAASRRPTVDPAPRRPWRTASRPARGRLRRRRALPRAPHVFAPQKGAYAGAGADPARAARGLVVPDLPGSGPKGGTRRRAGGDRRGCPLPGFDLVAERLGFAAPNSPKADLVVTGEGKLDLDVVYRKGRRPCARGRSCRRSRDARPRRRSPCKQPDRRRFRSSRALRVQKRALAEPAECLAETRRNRPGSPPRRTLSRLPEIAKPVADAPHIRYRPGLDGLRAIAVPPCSSTTPGSTGCRAGSSGSTCSSSSAAT